jgi:hypothetical protein
MPKRKIPFSHRYIGLVANAALVAYIGLFYFYDALTRFQIHFYGALIYTGVCVLIFALHFILVRGRKKQKHFLPRHYWREVHRGVFFGMMSIFWGGWANDFYRFSPTLELREQFFNIALILLAVNVFWALIVGSHFWFVRWMDKQDAILTD